jgi:hypothetical protein
MKLNEISGGQKVWMIWHREYDSQELYGIYTSEKLAKNALANEVNTKYIKDPEDYYQIEEAILNKTYTSGMM